MNSYAEKRLLPGQRAAIERDIPNGYRMTVQARMGAGDWSVRIYDDGGALCIVTHNHRTIKGGAYVALAKLAEAGVSAWGTSCVTCGYPFPAIPGTIEPVPHDCAAPMTVTVDLEGTPTLVGWEPNDAR
jgi:hypothetical protein